MIERLIIKPLYTEKDTHLGGVAKFGYVHLPVHDELYFTKEIKQKFRVLGIPFYVTTSLDMVHVPTEITSFIDMFLERERDLTIEFYRDTMRTMSKKANENAFEAIKSNEELPQEQKEDMLIRIKRDRERTDMMFDTLSQGEEKALSSFLTNRFELLYKVDMGSTKSYYIGRIIDDRLVCYNVELVKVKNVYVLSAVKSFYVTERFMKALKEKGGK